MSLTILGAPLGPLLLPFGVAVLFPVAIRLWLGASRAAALLGVAQFLGLLAAYVALSGAPAWPPEAPREKLLYVTGLGALLGLLLPVLPRWIDALQGAILVWPIVVVGWLAWGLPLGLQSGLAIVVLALAGVAVFGPLAAARQKDLRRALMLFCVTLGLAVIAVSGRSASLGHLALALAASIGGVLVAGGRLGITNANLIGPSGAALALAATLALFASGSRTALALLALVFAADRFAKRVAPRRYVWLERALFAFGCLVPLGLALAVVRLGTGALLPD
jgi:hypothetical protein